MVMEENETLLPLNTQPGSWRTAKVKGVEVRRISQLNNLITWRDMLSQTAKPTPPSADKLLSAFCRLGAMEDLSHRQLLAVADNFLLLDSHPVRPVHTTTLSNDMTDTVLCKWLYAMCGDTEKDEKSKKKKPFVLIKKQKLLLHICFSCKFRVEAPIQ